MTEKSSPQPAPARHTPGPWVVEDLGANCLTIKATGGVYVGSDAAPSTRDYYQRIGSVTQRDPHPSLAGGIPRQVTDANARLIAAAPELLQALATMVTAFAWGDMNDGEAAAIKEARTVLIKATGAQA